MHLNHFWKKMAFEAMDTDLESNCSSFSRQPPSHIVLPAIHLKKGEISEFFMKG